VKSLDRPKKRWRKMKMASSPESFSRSLWWNAAGEAKPNHSKLNGVHEADVVIVGGGFTGLSSALFLAERGKTVVVLEARHVGFGASGRNGGVVSTKYRVSLSVMAQPHGRQVAQRMNALGHKAMDCVESYVERFQIREANLAKTGNIRCAHNEAAFAALVEEAKTIRDIFGDTSITVLDANEVAAETGSTPMLALYILLVTAGVWPTPFFWPEASFTKIVPLFASRKKARQNSFVQNSDRSGANRF